MRIALRKDSRGVRSCATAGQDVRTATAISAMPQSPRFFLRRSGDISRLSLVRRPRSRYTPAMRTRLILTQTPCLFLLLLAVSAGCGKETIYVYPDGWAPAPEEDTAEDAPVYLFDTVPVDTTPDLADAGARSPDTPAPDTTPELPEWDFPAAPDIDFPDVIHLDGLIPEDTPPPEETYQFPEVTDDCDPLGLPTQWTGTFDGEIASNIPDFAGYTFNGPVYGEVGFEIKCVNQKYLVVGDLNGGSTNCALPTGCPFTAQMAGFYNPQAQHLSGQLGGVTIDYSMVIVHGEGEFEGDLTGGAVLEGTWFGEKTDIENLAIPGLDLSWVAAGGSGTWTASPVEEP